MTADARSQRPPRPAGTAQPVPALAILGVVLAAASSASAQVIGPVSSNPDRRDLEWLLLIPLGLNVLALSVWTAASLVVLARVVWRWWRTFAGYDTNSGT